MKKELTKLEKKVLGITGIASGTICIINKACQALATQHIIKYHAPYGHISDIFAIPLLSSIFFSIYKKTNPLTPAFYAAAYTIIDNAGWSGKPDMDAVFSYWVGAGITYAAIALSKERKEKPGMLEKKIEEER